MRKLQTLSQERKMATQNFKKRFGTVAVEKGFITLDQLLDAINIQIMENVEVEDQHRFIGTILFEQGLITTPQIDDVLKILGKNPN
jgi:hypothetical protein